MPLFIALGTACLALVTATLCAAWLLLGSTIYGHSLHISRFDIRNLTVEGIQYHYSNGDSAKDYHLSIASLRICLHLPRFSDPHIVRVTASCINARDVTHDAAISRASATLWLFPYALGITAGPLASVTLDGFELRVPSSAAQPWWVAAIRKNVVHTLLTGDKLRCDYFRTAVRFAPLTQNDKDDITLQTSWRRLHVLGQGCRMYTWEYVNSGLVEEVAGRGYLKIVAEDSRWMKMRDDLQRQKGPFTWRFFIYALAEFPKQLVDLFRRPAQHLDLYVSTLTVTFEQFRLRDAELYKQGITIAGQTLSKDSTRETLKDGLWDATAHLMLPSHS